MRDGAGDVSVALHEARRRHRWRSGGDVQARIEVAAQRRVDPTLEPGIDLGDAGPVAAEAHWGTTGTTPASPSLTSSTAGRPPRGRTYEQIAAEVGYTNRGTAYRVVQQVLGSRTVEAVENYRETELARLDALQHALWQFAIAGHIPSVRAVVRIIETRSRLLGLYGDARSADHRLARSSSHPMS